MPKGHYDRTDYTFDTWSQEEDAWLREACKTPTSYTKLAQEHNRLFPNEKRRSRNAILGRATRKGYNLNKPTEGSKVMVTRARRKSMPVDIAKPPAVRDQEKRGRIKLGKDVKAAKLLRAESDPGLPNSMVPSRKLAINHPTVVERKKGRILAIVEEKPLSSVPVATCDKDSCMWPTSTDVSCMEVCGQRVVAGAYCARHALLAYRTMPTRKRQGTRSKEDMEYARRADGTHQRRELDPDGEWLSRMILDAPELQELESPVVALLEQLDEVDEED